MKSSDLNRYTKGTLVVVALLAELEKATGRPQAATYRGLSKKTNTPEATVRRWVREARGVQLVEPVGSDGGGKAEDGQAARVAYKLTPAGRVVAEL